MDVFAIIEEQQKGKESKAVWMVGEHLKDICRREPACQAILEEDLQNEDMSLANAEKKIHEWADNNRKNERSFCVPPQVAEDILREFYGLPTRHEQASASAPKGQLLSLLDLMK